ncbi:hypothetical protein ACIBI7_53835 [Nonomuraea fuscirosea]
MKRKLKETGCGSTMKLGPTGIRAEERKARRNQSRPDGRIDP